MHSGAFAFNEGARARARQALGIDPQEVVVLYVGRLSFHQKAHHVPMYIALEQAAVGHRVVLLQAGWFPSKSVEAAFHQEAYRFCPSVRCIFLDGRDAVIREQAWASADLFTSLVDNFQETFGLTPIEAMAAGLPSVISDWDGYRDTVRNGIDGFRVPTLSMPPGTGGDIADRYDWGIDSFEFYLFHTSQLVSVDIDAAADAYRRLISDPDLRARMGQAARRRAVGEFDWAVILEKYRGLWLELAERRRADPAFDLPSEPRRRPDRADPYSMFRTYATHTAGPRVQFQRRPGVDLGEAVSWLQLESTGRAAAFLPTPDLITSIYAFLSEDTWVSADDLFQGCSNNEKEDLLVRRAAVWLCKFGALRFREAHDDPDE